MTDGFFNSTISFSILSFYYDLLIVKDNVGKPDLMWTQVNCFYSSVLRSVPFQKMVVPCLVFNNDNIVIIIILII